MDFLVQAVTKLNGVLKDIGADAPGNFKVYKSDNSRTNIFVKADKWPGQPAIALSFDLPGESDAVTVQVLNAGLQAGKGNAPA